MSFCSKENDGVALCVCKYRPCNEIKKYKEAINEIRKSIIERHCETCKEQTVNSDCDDCIIGEIAYVIDELQLLDEEPA